MRLGDCRTCRRSDRRAIEAAHDAGEPTRALARRLGLPESSLRRHFKECRRQRPNPPRTRTVTRAHLEAVAAEFGLTFAEVLRHHVVCRNGDVAVTSDKEAHELCELAGLLEEGATCCA